MTIYMLGGYAVLFKQDSARRIDRVIDYFGEPSNRMSSPPSGCSEKRPPLILHRNGGGQ